MESPNQNQILEKVRQSSSHKVKVAVTDIDGILRGKYIHKDKFFSAVEGGFGFCNVVFGWDMADVVYDNARYTGWHTGYPDAEVRLDLNTYREIPWDNKTPFFLGHFVEDENQPLLICPRQLLRSVIKRSESKGFLPMAGLEFEWFNFRESPQSLEDKGHIQPEPLTPGMFGYSILRAGYERDYFNALMDEMEEFSVPLEGLHTETGPGVYEAAIAVSDALTAADRAVLFKSGTKEIAYRYGIIPSFMAKWNAQLPGCSGHIHQSLWEIGDKKNLFYDPNDPLKMSKLFKHYLAGQMHCLPAILPMLAPNVNSYKRLVEGLWAPTRINWAVDNRTAAFRVIPGSPKSTRLETRTAGADINPYLALAAAIASGLYGIENELPLQPETKGNGYADEGAKRLPNNLYRATEKMVRSEIARELFGDDFVDHFTATRHWEWRQYQTAVTDWELRRYFEII
ncbi:MAG: glutamine synthetase [Bdellovibrionaceae bacterium]|nr:glutamine synthetase [Bdellovibrionales bacterium]MCB9084144.1 glutamine synthetase [Pseudobdellovibrionaceae bacterium]